jgi:phosphoribosylformimino-5-aminoimidazole carboxamide ribotide isomerase
MRILPVLDLLDGQVVRGVAGRRSEYRPIVSQLTRSTAPLDVARVFREQFGLHELYLADLNAIAGKTPALPLFVDLLKDGFRLWVDAGIGHDGKNLHALAALGVEHPIAGLESLQSPLELKTYLERFGPGLVFSLDLKEGQPLGHVDQWNFPDPWAIARQALKLGIENILVLDLAAVGVNQGSRTTDVCRRLRRELELGAMPSPLPPVTSSPEATRRRHANPDQPRPLTIATGGGIRDKSDLALLQRAGVDIVLVASALHDGRLTSEDIAAY